MKKFIFYTTKSGPNTWNTFSIYLKTIFTSFIETKVFAKALLFYMILLFIGFGNAPNSYGQTTQGAAVVAKFGVDADIYANHQQFGGITNASGYDDWFYSSTWTGAGIGIIDQSNAATVKSSIQSNNNYSFTRRMNMPVRTRIGNINYVDAIYGRDNNSTQGNSDATTFSGQSNKNGDNPSTWTFAPGNIPQKNDIIDVFGHIRRDFTNNPTTGELWGFGGATTVSTDGNAHYDFEFFRAVPDNINDANNDGILDTLTYGPAEGHTAWIFNNDGTILSPGDLLIAIDFENGGTVPNASVRIWVKKSDFINFNINHPLRGFNMNNNFDQGNGAIEYGYAEIVPLVGSVLPIYSVVNVGGDTLGSPWGSLEGSNAAYQNDIKLRQFAEFGINLTEMGLDVRRIDQGACSNLIGALLVKTRSSSSFTAELKDYAGPFLFGNFTEVNVEAMPDAVLTCANPTITLTTVLKTPESATLTWFGPSPSEGNEGPPLVGENPVISLPGVYTVHANANLIGCFKTDTVTITEDKTPPNVNDITNVVKCSTDTPYVLPAITGSNLSGNEAYWTQTGGTGTNLAVGASITSTQTIFIYDATGTVPNCSDEESFTVTIEICGGPLCTYTQGAYGTNGGMSCAPDENGIFKKYSTKDIIAKGLSSYPGGTMTIGMSPNSVWMTTPQDVDDIIRLLPGGGGGSYALTGNYSVSDPLFPASYLTSKGTLNNTLLAQTITLGLNLGINGALGSFVLQGGDLVTADADGGCGTTTFKRQECVYDQYGVLTVMNGYHYSAIDPSVVAEIEGDKTIQGLFALANKALGDVNYSGVSLTKIADVVDKINNAFDGCKIFVGYDVPKCSGTNESFSTLTAKTEVASFDAYPVPFKNQLTIKSNFDYATDVLIEVFNAQGVLVLSQTDTNSYLGKETTLNFNLTAGQEQVFIVKVTTNRGSSTKEVMSSN